MHQFVYPAIFYKDEDTVRVMFPDIKLETEGAFVEEAFLYAKEFLAEYMRYALKYDLDYNEPTDYEKIKTDLKKTEDLMLIYTSITDKDIKN